MWPVVVVLSRRFQHVDADPLWQIDRQEAPSMKGTQKQNGLPTLYIGNPIYLISILENQD